MNQQGCTSTIADLAKCCVCSKWGCESCNEIPVTKLKPIIEKCPRVYFVCTNCDERIHNCEFALPEEDTSATNEPNESKFERMILSKLEGIEDRIDETITRKLAENNVNLDLKMKHVTESYAETLKQNLLQTNNEKPEPSNLRDIIREQKNEELVQEQEREARAANIIIHGLTEAPDTLGGKEVDSEVIMEFLKTIEINSVPVSVSRIGGKRPVSDKPRPLKIRMKNQGDKESVMSNLNKLKEAPENMRKISVTDDYTNEEREEIRKKVNEAKNKTELEGNGKYIFKVRGTPKNGLVVRRFAKAVPSV